MYSQLDRPQIKMLQKDMTFKYVAVKLSKR